VRRILRDRRTFAAVVVTVVLVSVVIGSLRDEDGGDASDDSPAAPTIKVSQSPSPSEDATPDDEETGPAFPTAVAPSARRIDPESGLVLVDLADLPPEAVETVDLIDAGGPFPYSDDGETFLNSAGLLPEREVGHYRVYTVETPGSVDDGRRRIVTGADDELYWTDDRYRSFREIER